MLLVSQPFSHGTTANVDYQNYFQEEVQFGFRFLRLLPPEQAFLLLLRVRHLQVFKLKSFQVFSYFVDYQARFDIVFDLFEVLAFTYVQF